MPLVAATHHRLLPSPQTSACRNGGARHSEAMNSQTTTALDSRKPLIRVALVLSAHGLSCSCPRCSRSTPMSVPCTSPPARRYRSRFCLVGAIWRWPSSHSDSCRRLPCLMDRFAETLLAEIGRPYRLGSQTARVSVSVGIAFHPSDGRTSVALMHAADQAIYAAKTQGKNRFMRHSVISESPESV